MSTKLVDLPAPGITGFVNVCGDLVVSLYLNKINSNLPVSNSSYQSTPGVYYFFHLSAAMDTLIYSTYFGANDANCHSHGTANVIDTNGIIWASSCLSMVKDSLQGTPGSYCSKSLSTGSYSDFFSAKFDMEVLPAKPLAKAVIPDTVCAKADVYFYNQSKNAYSYIWHFGDGDTSHAKNPVHSYDTPGYYRLKLEAYNPYSCRPVDSLVKTVFVDTNEIFSSFASVDTSCIGNTVHFYNTSRNSITTLWDYGDGTSSTTFHGQHVYAAGGQYLVKLISNNPDFCNKTDTAFRLLTIDTTGPRANFTIPYTVACADKPQQFTNTTARGVSYQWSFGDGATSFVSNPTHIYTTGGKHTIRLIATNAKLCNPVDTAYDTIEILPPLQFDLADSFICGGNEPVEWGIKLTHVNSNPTYSWGPANAIISGGGQPVAIVDPRIATKYYITVTDTIPGSCAHQRSDTAVLTIVDYPDSVVATSNSPVCEGDALLLKGTTSSNIPFLKYSWEGPGSYMASGQNAGREAIAMNQAGKYILAISNQGCISYADADVVVKPKPKIETGSNSPVWTGKELKLTLTTDKQLDSFYWTGPMGFYSTEQYPVLKPVVLEMEGSYALRAWHDGCLSGDITLVKVSEVDSHYLRIYPNPSSGNFYVEGKGYHEQEIKMLIVNSIGQKLYNASVNTEKKHFKHHITMPPISDGVYIIWVLMDGEYKGLTFTVLSD
ncbi:MAG: PKD domain-containing protein [Taibaiella sp.]|nr:PKD domain-containing protein [Taibaiella sp.]